MRAPGKPSLTGGPIIPGGPGGPGSPYGERKRQTWAGDIQGLWGGAAPRAWHIPTPHPQPWLAILAIQSFQASRALQGQGRDLGVTSPERLLRDQHRNRSNCDRQGEPLPECLEVQGVQGALASLWAPARPHCPVRTTPGSGWPPGATTRSCPHGTHLLCRRSWWPSRANLPWEAGGALKRRAIFPRDE